jgi:hypothetical protein
VGAADFSGIDGSALLFYGPQRYVVAGDWIDPEWAALAKNPTKPLSYEETRRLIAGPRRHPFGPGAWQVMRNGQALIYPSRTAASE